MRRRVRPGHRAVARRAPRRQPQGESGLLGNDDGAERSREARARLDVTELGQGVLGAREPGRAVVGDPLGAEVAAGFLVGGGEEDQAALEGRPRSLEGQAGHELQDPRRLHVQRAAPVEVSVADHAAERVHAPVPPVRVDHVDVVMEHDGRQRAVAVEPRDEIAATRSRLGDLARHAFGVEDPGEEPRAVALVARRIGRVHHQVAPEDLDRLLAERGPVHHDGGAGGPNVVQ